MSFKHGRKRGDLWQDAQELDKFINNYSFHTTGKKEKDFEIGFSNSLMNAKSMFKNKIITQIDKTEKVVSVYCFGKNHRPDLTINNDGIAVEIKFTSYGGLNKAIGQGFFYRLKYRFSFLVLVISENNKQLYEDIENGKEKDLEDILTTLAQEKNIFTYIVPSFIINKPGIRKCISFFST